MFDKLRGDDSKAMIFSSAKIQQARRLAILKDDEKAMQTEQKATGKQEKMIQKEAKATEVAQRKLDKENTRIKKAQDLTEKRAIKEETKLAKQAAQQIQSDLKERTKERRRKTPLIVVQKEMALIEETAVERDHGSYQYDSGSNIK